LNSRPTRRGVDIFMAGTQTGGTRPENGLVQMKRKKKRERTSFGFSSINAEETASRLEEERLAKSSLLSFTGFQTKRGK